MAKQTDFNRFLSNIEPSSTTTSYISSVQNSLRTYLQNHDTYKDVHIDTFLSGSYAKHTAIRPASGDNKRDVDIVVVTTYSADTDPRNVLSELKSVLKEKSIYNTAKIQKHSIGIELSEISIDVVPVIRDTNDNSLYYIGDFSDGTWAKTDPKGHKSWSTQVNIDSDKKYKPLVKMFKWWRRTNCPSNTKYPKGITLEKIIADNLGDSSLSTEDLFIATMQNIISSYKEDYVDERKNPVIEDPSKKITGNDLLSGYSIMDFSDFILKLYEHSDLLNTEGTGNDTWRKILGSTFPQDSSEKNIYALSRITSCLSVPHRQKPVWPIQRGCAAFISAKVVTSTGYDVEYCSNGEALEKGYSLHFKAMTGVKTPYKVFWQIVNTGMEATNADCLRGNFETSDEGENGKRESTMYSGTHSVQCFIIKRGICVAKSKEFIINIK